MAKTIKKKECNEPGCNKTTIGPYCERHAKSNSSKPRSGADPRPYLNKDYQQARANVLAKWPLCWICNKARSVIVDHVDNNPSNNKPDNLRGACNSCNTRKGYQHRKGINQTDRH